MPLFKKQFFIIFGISAFLFSAIGHAEIMATVGKNDCAHLANTKSSFILVLEKNDKLIQSISQCAADAKLQGATVSGLGQLHDLELAYFPKVLNGKPKVTKFPHYYELSSLCGNVSLIEAGKKYYTHIHAVFADAKFHAIAGHVNEAQVGLTAEITIIPTENKVLRLSDPVSGFGTLSK